MSTPMPGPGYAAARGLLLRQWEPAQAIVYDAEGNSTHLVDGRAAALLAALLDAATPLSPVAVAELADPEVLQALVRAGMVVEARR